jgi:peptidoglycan/xylan/chitin deacetylase (PgdA/CDA1 family)
MKPVLKKILVKTLFLSGLPYIFREYILRKKVTILVLHDPEIKMMEKYLQWLAAHYNLISLEQYISYREGEKGTSLPEKSLIITLDDGHIGNYKLLPIIKASGIPVSVFLCSGIVNTNRHYWFKYCDLKTSFDSLKYIPDNKRLEYLAKVGFYPSKEFSHPQALNKEQIMEMKEYVNFQGHTIFHPCLNRCSDEESWTEIHESKKHLESEYGIHINAIAYPNGDYSERDIRFVKQAGYTCGLTVDHGLNGKRTSLFKLKRYSVNDNDTLDLLAIKASGVWSFLTYIFKKIPFRFMYSTLFSGRKFMRIFIFMIPGMEDIACL